MLKPKVFFVLARAILVSAVALADYFLPAAEPASPSTDPTPQVASASEEGERAIKQFKVPKDFKVELIAAEPHLANPVAFWIDEKGNIYVAETYRLNEDVPDIRGQMQWLDEDLASQSVADRVAMLKKHLGDKVSTLARNTDRLKLIVVGADGKAERSTVFADGFSNIPDGIGSGVLARNGNVFYANIPDLWLLRDTNGDGVADFRKSLHYGYGVRVGFVGHDLHGLRIGPDGKLYFTVGDRGAHLQTQEGKVVASHETGAVFRCHQDGSELEMFATGLRNPQELAFDQYGNLFTGDNNADGGDKARWVYLVEGGDSGWRCGYQYLRSPVKLGAWNGERMWHPQWPGQAAFLVPPIENIASGPSGTTYYPGTGLPERYQEHFFLVDFRGSSGSGIHSFALQPNGASFKLNDREDFVWGTLATDVDFGIDSGIYWSDWVQGWNKTGKGRIYRAYSPEIANRPLVLATRKLLGGGMAQRPIRELAALLAHPDMRVRQEAQFALADKGAVKILSQIAARNENQLARLHAIWGLGQIHANSRSKNPRTLQPLIRLLADQDMEVRAQAARVLGEGRSAKALDGLVKLLADPSPRNRFFAALALGKLGGKEATRPIIEMLRANNDQDAFLRHAGVMGLLGCNDPSVLQEAAQDKSAAVRMGSLLVMRRQEMPEIASFLHDPDTNLVREAARAINDLPIVAALPQLAALITQPNLDETALRRAVNANFRLSKAEHARALAALAASSDAPEVARLEALEDLKDWARPSGRDRITGLWRPLPARDARMACAAMAPTLPALLHQASEAVRIAGIRAAAHLSMIEAAADLRQLTVNTNDTPKIRVEALQALAALKDPYLDQAVQAALADPSEALHKEGTKLQALLQPRDASDSLSASLDHGTIGEKQTALQTLATLTDASAERILSDWMDRLLAGTVPLELHLDLLEAAGKHATPALKEKIDRFEKARPAADPLGRYREALAGGDPAEGRKIFFDRPEASCVRCHKVNGEGGDVGADLTGVGSRQTREYLLESIVFPNARIAAGFESVIVTLKNGSTYAGVLKRETDAALEINSPEDGLLTLPKADIGSREKGLSAMPEELRQVLSKQDLRNLVEFLSMLK